MPCLPNTGMHVCCAKAFICAALQRATLPEMPKEPARSQRLACVLRCPHAFAPYRTPCAGQELTGQLQYRPNELPGHLDYTVPDGKGLQASQGQAMGRSHRACKGHTRACRSSAAETLR